MENASRFPQPTTATASIDLSHICLNHYTGLPAIPLGTQRRRRLAAERSAPGMRGCPDGPWTDGSRIWPFFASARRSFLLRLLLDAASALTKLASRGPRPWNRTEREVGTPFAENGKRTGWEVICYALRPHCDVSFLGSRARVRLFVYNCGIMNKRLLRRDEVMDLLQISEATLYRWQREGIIPQPVSLGPRSKRWPRDEIEAFIAAKQHKRDIELDQD